LNGIKTNRERLGINQRQLAELLGVYPSTICMWEAGDRKPSSDKLPELAKILGCSIDDLFDNENG